MLRKTRNLVVICQFACPQLTSEGIKPADVRWKINCKRKERKSGIKKKLLSISLVTVTSHLIVKKHRQSVKSQITAELCQDIFSEVSR